MGNAEVRGRTCEVSVNISNKDLHFVFLFFKQQTAYEISLWLEFRRVLFRSIFLMLSSKLRNDLI